MLRQWFKGSLGQDLLEMEKIRVNRVLSDLFGYHIVQIGYLTQYDLLVGSRISHKTILQLEEDTGYADVVDLICSDASLAIAADSMDVVFMPHVLEFTANPHQLLREVDRVLIGDGNLVILGFNPWSLWGLWRLALAWRETPPWCGHFYGFSRLKDWLSLLDFELLNVERFFFRPPLQKVNVMNRIRFLEKLGKYCWPFFGGAYIITARKRVIPLTPMKLRWRDRGRVIPSGIAEPSARLHDTVQ